MPRRKDSVPRHRPSGESGEHALVLAATALARVEALLTWMEERQQQLVNPNQIRPEVHLTRMLRNTIMELIDATPSRPCGEPSCQVCYTHGSEGGD